MMATVAEHYKRVLGAVYSWMVGGFEQGVAVNEAVFDRLGIVDGGGTVAVDLGAGCGFQSIPLARREYSLVAIDLDRGLLDELESHRGNLGIQTVQGDLLEFENCVDGEVGLFVCMTDTLLHLESKADVVRLFKRCYARLADGGQMIITFRDLTGELVGADRFIPVRSDDGCIMTCFLEYEAEAVKVHDLVYVKGETGWELKTSFYRKLRLGKNWVEEQLRAAGFGDVAMRVEKGVVEVVAKK